MISKDFVLAGDATFTIALPNEAGHYTFRVQRVEASDRYPESYFVKLLTGPDNTSDYTYLGKLCPHSGSVRTTGRSKYTNDSFPVRLLNRVLVHVYAGTHEAYEAHGYKTHHEGRCGRCNRLLTVPASIESGIGPECSRIMLRESGSVLSA